MDHNERQQLKQLANDSIIATFGRDDNESRLAQALEKCINLLNEMCGDCDTCSYCAKHGDYEDE